MKVGLQTGPEGNLDFSEMYIFGKFDTFCRRLNKVGIKIVATMVLPLMS